MNNSATTDSLWRQIIEVSTEIIMLVDLDGTILLVNRDPPDRRAEDLLGRSYLEFLPSPYRQVASACIARVVETRQADLYHAEYHAEDGGAWYYAVRVTPLLVSGELSSLILTAEDITERRRVEQALLEKSAELEAVLKAFPDLFFRLGADGVFLDYYAGRSSDLYLQPEAFLGQQMTDVLPPEIAEAYEAAVAQVQAGQPMVTVEYSLPMPDGTKYFESRILPLGQDQIIVLVRDVTPIKQAEQERIHLEAKVQHAQKLESLGVLAGGIAHDFNNLLVGILGNAELALMDLAPTSQARQLILDIEVAAQRSADLARQMLAYSGKGKFTIERLELQSIVDEMTHLLETSISKKVRLKFDFSTAAPPVEGDVNQMRQIIMNLVVNASEAIGDHSGEISVRTGVMECDQSYLEEADLDSGLRAGLYTFLEVTDTGEGMTPQTISRIFDPFFTTKFTGRGLGLAAVLGIMRGHHGAIKVHSVPGRGTTFKILFPAAAGGIAPPAPVPPATVMAGSLADRIVLLADDDETVRSVARRMLERLGAEVEVVQDGQEALAAFRAAPARYDCVLLDLTMPRLDGEETFQELRRLREDACVVLSSGYNEQDLIDRFTIKGLNGFIQKPYTPAQLKDVLLDALKIERTD